jgi:hypothetical protein
MELNVHVRSVKQKFSLIKCCDNTSSKKKFIEKYLCWFSYEELYVPFKTMLEKIISLISSFIDLYEVVDDNSNHYRSMVINGIWINHVYSGLDSHNIPLNEKPNVNTVRFFELLKGSDKPL